MSEVNTATSGNDVDFDAFAEYLMLSQIFQNILKKPEPDDDAEVSQSGGVANEINKSIATAMAQSVTGFGL